MMSCRSALLVALVCLIMAAGVVPIVGPTVAQTDADPNPLIVTIDNTTNQLSIPENEVRRSDHAKQGLDVGTAVEAGSVRLQSRHDGISFRERFQRAGSDEARQQLLETEVREIEQRETALTDRIERITSQYADSRLSTRGFLGVRRLINVEATALVGRLNGLNTASDTAPQFTASQATATRIRTVEGGLRTLTGAVSGRLGTDDSHTVYLEASESGYMLGVIDNGEYIRETRLGDERDPTRPDQFLQAAEENGDRFSAADNRASELYTWLYSRQRPSFTYYGTSGIYELTATYPSGELTSYIDAGTTNVFYEEQIRELSAVQTTEGQTVTNGSVEVTLRRSVRTNPLLISVTRGGMGIDGTITINGDPVGQTGQDGVHWTVEPTGDYTVNVTADGRTITVPVAR
jgi:hypothetical protein